MSADNYDAEAFGHRTIEGHFKALATRAEHEMHLTLEIPQTWKPDSSPAFLQACKEREAIYALFLKD